MTVADGGGGHFVASERMMVGISAVSGRSTAALKWPKTTGLTLLHRPRRFLDLLVANNCRACRRSFPDQICWSCRSAIQITEHLVLVAAVGID